MANQSVDAAASTSNKQKKLTDEERKERQKEYDRKRYQENKEQICERVRLYREANREKLSKASSQYNSQYYQANKKHLQAKHREWRKSNAKQFAKQKLQWQQQNKEKAAEYNKKWYESNKDVCIKKHNTYRRKKRQSDNAYRLKANQRTRLYDALIGKAKRGSAVRDMGCTGQEACDHLESLFDEHMTWDNWGTYWEVDHIYPLAKANLENRIEFLAVNNWRNLQPLEKGENNRKGDTVTPEAQKLFDDLKTQFQKEDAA